MDDQTLQQLLRQVSEGAVSPDAALERMQQESFRDLGFAKLDHQREARTGFPEVVFAPGKGLEHLVQICRGLREAHSRVLVTRCTPEQAERLAAEVPGGRHNATARTMVYGEPEAQVGDVLVICAGTSDLPVAEEALETLRLMGNRAELLADVGVAGLHRLLSHDQRLRQARVVIVVAGMEGALPSVVGGLVKVPLIAVPTSIGYGASFQGLAALLGMLNSCASGVTVVNIDNGFGAGVAASKINRLPPAE